MGGRGSNSASHRDAATSPVAKMGDGRLGGELKAVEGSMEKAARVMDENARGHTGYLQGTPWGSAAAHKAYVEASDEYRSLRARRNAIVDEQARRKQERAAAEPPKQKTFVNSYGEATTRHVTSAIYERAMKRQEKAVLRNMGH